MSDSNAIATAQAGAAPPAEGASPASEQVTSGAAPQAAHVADAPDGARPSRAQERIEELSARARAGTELAEYWRSRFEETQRQQTTAAPAPVVAQEDPEPDPDAFEDPKAYTKAYTAWYDKKAEKRIQSFQTQAQKDAETAAEKRLAKAKEEERLRVLNDDFGLRQMEFAEKTPDYRDTVINNRALTFLNGDFLEAVMASEKGPEVIYHIAKDAKLVARLAGKSVPQRLAEFGRIQAELSRPAPPPKVTAAPAPPTPIGGGAGGEVDPSKMSIEDWMRHRTKQLREQRSGR